MGRPRKDESGPIVKSGSITVNVDKDVYEYLVRQASRASLDTGENISIREQLRVEIMPFMDREEDVQ